MDQSSKLFLVILLLLWWAVIGFSGYFNVTNTTTTSEYNVSNSTFQMSDWWDVIKRTNDSITFDNRNGMSYATRGGKVITLNLTQYTDISTFESKYQGSKHLSGNYIVSTENKSIGGIQVRFINNTDTKSNETVQDYYFRKNGKYYSIHIVGKNGVVNELHSYSIKLTVESIINSLQ
ncbi:MAG TPA: hypothetical protein VK444_03375 [Methanobacteriaceae archaeon]|nr:hypothetical protein [Methanobacteriaceae archaeon]